MSKGSMSSGIKNLDLRAMKNSRRRKHHTIYDKAHRLITEGFETQHLSDSEIERIAKGFPQLSIRIVAGGNIIVRSKKDTWIIRDEVRFLTLFHRSLHFGSRRTFERYHVQDVFYDLEFALASIVSHDEYSLGIKRHNIDGIHKLVTQSKLEHATV